MDDPAQVGEPCFVVDSIVSGIDNCDLGAYCWDVACLADPRRAERLKRFIRPSHTAIDHVSTVARMMTTLA